MKETMTAKERMMAVYRGREVDHPAVGAYLGCIPKGEVEFDVRKLGVGLVKISIPNTTHLIGSSWATNPNFCARVKNVSIREQHYWKNGMRIERWTYETPIGSVYQETCFERGHMNLGKKVLKYYISDIEDYKIVQYIVENTEFDSLNANFLPALEELGQDGVELAVMHKSPFQYCMYNLCGPEQFLVDLMTEEDEVLPLMEALEEKMTESLKLSVNSPADGFWHPENITCDMTPPNLFEKFCLPIYQKFSKIIKETDKPYICHVDGKFKLLAGMIKESGIDVVESISVPEMGGDVSYQEARRLLPNQVLVPNFPSNLSFAREEEIVAFVHGVKENAGKIPFMIEVSENIPHDAWKRVFPILCRELL